MWEGSRDGEPGMRPSPPCWEKARLKGPGGRRRASQEGLLPKRLQRSLGGREGESPECGGHLGLVGLPRQRLLYPWLPSQGQNFPGPRGHCGAGDGGG